MPTHYETLKVASDAPAEVIRAAYRALSQRYHPDRNAGDAGAVRTMQALNEAYALLSDPEQRRRYDEAIAAQRRSTARMEPRGATMAVPPTLARAAREYRRHAPAGAAAPPPRRARRAAIILLLVAPPAIGIGVGVWMSSHRSVSEGAVPWVAEPAAEWRMRALDAPTVAAAAAPSSPAPTAREEPAPEPAGAPATAPLALAPAPAAAPAAPARLSPHGVPLPIVADPNGRAWPFEAGYVPGMRQDFTDGLASVNVNNLASPAPAFVKLVALDAGAQPVRHVYIPPMDAFAIEGVRAGRYELRFQNLVTGELSRSDAFELRQHQGRYGARFSQVEVTLSRLPGGSLGTYPLAAEDF
ncbi:J domain-containing protein [Lysobacter korlensis]|uniref:J domain-containing protein n=1 Tax=Lysobacter korlensis TaxID=553636 RepID=A0ABV6RR35_9GAMM